MCQTHGWNSSWKCCPMPGRRKEIPAARGSQVSWTQVCCSSDSCPACRACLSLCRARHRCSFVRWVLQVYPVVHAGALRSVLALENGNDEQPEEDRQMAAWLRAPHTGASLLQKSQLREIGWSRSARASGILLPPEQFVEQLRYQRTVRGHHFAVYCIAFNRSGRRIITGSDDRLVKVIMCACCRVIMSACTLLVSSDGIALKSIPDRILCLGCNYQKIQKRPGSCALMAGCWVSDADLERGDCAAAHVLSGP